MPQTKNKSTEGCDTFASSLDRYLSQTSEELREFVSHTTAKDVELLSNLKLTLKAGISLNSQEAKDIKQLISNRIGLLNAYKKADSFATQYRDYLGDFYPSDTGYCVRIMAPYGGVFSIGTNILDRNGVQIEFKNIVDAWLKPSRSLGQKEEIARIAKPVWRMKIDLAARSSTGSEEFWVRMDELSLSEQLLYSYLACKKYAEELREYAKDENNSPYAPMNLRLQKTINHELDYRFALCNQGMGKDFLNDWRGIDYTLEADKLLITHAMGAMKHSECLIMEKDKHGHKGHKAYFDSAVAITQFFNIAQKTKLHNLGKLAECFIEPDMLEELRGAGFSIYVIDEGILAPTQELEIKAPELEIPEAVESITVEDAPIIPIATNIIQLPLTGDEAKLLETQINDLFESGAKLFEEAKAKLIATDKAIRKILIELDIREGYKALGFENMSEYMASGRIKRARATLQKQWHAGKLEHTWGVEVGSLPEIQCHELKLLEPDTAKEIAIITATLIKSGDNEREAFRKAYEQVTQQPTPSKAPKTKCRRVVNKDATTRFEVNLAGNKYDLAMTEFGEAVVHFEEECNELNVAPETLLAQRALETLANSWGCSLPAAISKLMQLEAPATQETSSNLVHFPTAS